MAFFPWLWHIKNDISVAEQEATQAWPTALQHQSYQMLLCDHPKNLEDSILKSHPSQHWVKADQLRAIL